MLSLSYQSLEDFTGLPRVREAVARGETGLLVHGLPPFVRDLPLDDIPHDYQAQKNNDANPLAVVVMQTLHRFSHCVFNNLSHVAELPWEKYLGEMHEFLAPGTDELRVFSPDQHVPSYWSTLSIVINKSNPEKALVAFGTALSVFTEGMTPEPTGSSIDLSELSGSFDKPKGDWVVYYVRPNNGVFYTRTAGALMTPLSTKDYHEGKRVQDLKIIQ
ncbi:hypothetical protein ACKRZS_010610 [Fusarium odoratissimum]|uniref:Uncharacterized protein n=2 Tax=Fusarium oxysporum species complex TaxID=171631 RepID=X0IR38_FUSO5|nr:uncharacterized protein FOIG_15515 [Fusarium odoratissimum NRRL 54006]EXL91363.1 hypothetical protein FOIG_15515 [Fusarium odoratissimum NRRL 54006]KAK2123292.1 hypothetical protein NOF04DRAFT_18002 [Fusarium oxysporum II5]TXB96542.1 hypothetical protein FocTR4_00011865 [Fusarium oxysporum f. sp. cubense]